MTGPRIHRAASEAGAAPASYFSADLYSEPPPQSPISAFPTHLSGQQVLVVFNRNAQGGAFAKELPKLERALKQEGARVQVIETHANPGLRLQVIDTALRRMLAGRETVLVIPWGGDGTVGDAEMGMLRAVDVVLHAPDSWRNSQAWERFNSRLAIVLGDKGTYADRAFAVGGTAHARKVPGFIRQGIPIPYRLPIIETPRISSPGESLFEVAGHSLSLGVGGYLFALQQQNKRKSLSAAAASASIGLEHLQRPLNRRRSSFLRLLLPSIFSRYGLLGFDVKLNHYGRDGSLQHSATLRGTEVMVTSNRVIAGYGGIPGAWGDTKLLVLPSGPLGVLGLSEIVGRGVLTKYLGLNMVGPTSRLLTLAGKRQILIHPGESVQVQLQVPDTWRWNALRRIRASAEPIPAAGAPMGVPAIRDGEVAGRISDFTVRVPETFGVLLAHPQSQAVRLIRASALARGTEPLVSDQQLLSRTAKRWGRTAVGNRKGGVRVQTDFLSQPRLFQLVKQYKIPFELTADLLVATQAISHSEKLGQLADPKTPLSIKRIEQFLTSEAGDKWLRRNRALGRTADRRILEGGVPLAAGILALWGGEHLADAVGLDPRQDQVLRFGLVAYVAYGVHRNVTPLWEVHANRMLGRPYDQVRTRNVRVAGEIFTQWTFRRHPSLPGAAVSSWSSGALQINPRTLRPLSPENYHRRVPLSRKIENLAALPFRAAWNMGHVLICSAAAAGLAVHLPEGSFLKRYGPEAALFMPDVGRFLAPGLTFQFLENLPVRLAARALAVGFMADMAYMGMRRYALGPEADYENSLNYRAAQLRRDAVDIAPWSFRNIFGFLAPSLSAHLDSHAYGFGKENEYRRLVRRHDLEMPERLKGAVRRETPWISRALSVTPGEVFQTKVTLTPLENDMVSSLEFAHANKLVSERGSLEETAGYLMEQFRGYRLTSEQTYRHLARIRLSQLQDEISQMHVLNRLEGLELQILFDREGKIKPGKEISFLNWLRPEPFADPLWLAVGT